MKPLPSLFEPEPSAPEDGVTYAKIAARKATFKAGLQRPVHGWFRLTPSFGPDLVQLLASEMKCNGDTLLFDPFGGASTTLIEGRLLGFETLGYEINPLLHFVGQTCLRWDLESAELRLGLELVEAKFRALIATHRDKPLSEQPCPVPAIFNPLRWWREDVLRDLLCLKAAINSTADDSTRSFFRLALAAVLVPDLTNVTLGRLQLHFIERNDEEIRVWETWRQHTLRMLEDLDRLAKQFPDPRPAKLVFGDSTRLEPREFSRPITHVITSPPYPNRYSYVWNTRPHLYMLDFFQDRSAGSELDERTIGSTWGTATSSLMNITIKPANEVVAAALNGVADEIATQDRLMANYAIKYFNMMHTHVESMLPLLAPGAQLAYVVGCSRLKGVFLETDKVLAQIFKGLGFAVPEVRRFRKRNSGKDLHETIVFATKSS